MTSISKVKGLELFTAQHVFIDVIGLRKYKLLSYIQRIIQYKQYKITNVQVTSNKIYTI